MKAIDTVMVNDDLTKAKITSTITEKYARKLLQEFLITASGYHGWSCWLDETDDTQYHFSIYNSWYNASRIFNER